MNTLSDDAGDQPGKRSSAVPSGGHRRSRAGPAGRGIRTWPPSAPRRRSSYTGWQRAVLVIMILDLLLTIIIIVILVTRP